MAITTEEFAFEVQRRLLDTWEVMILLDIRTKQTLFDRVERGEVPAPIAHKGQKAYWDRDALELERVAS